MVQIQLMIAQNKICFCDFSWHRMNFYICIVMQSIDFAWITNLLYTKKIPKKNTSCIPLTLRRIILHSKVPSHGLLIQWTRGSHNFTLFYEQTVHTGANRTLNWKEWNEMKVMGWNWMQWHGTALNSIKAVFIWSCENLPSV